MLTTAPKPNSVNKAVTTPLDHTAAHVIATSTLPLIYIAA